MNSKNELKDFIKTRGSVLLLFAFAIVGGTLYAIYLKQNYSLEMGYVQNYLMDSKAKQGMTVQNVFMTFLSYFKRYSIVWILGLVSFAVPIAIGVTVLDVFGYGFAVAALYLTFGKIGFLMAGHLFMIQGVLLIGLLLELVRFIIQKNTVFKTEEHNNYGTYLIVGFLGCGFIAVCELLLSWWG